MSSTSMLTGEIAAAREAVAGRLRGVDPDDLAAVRGAYDAFSQNDATPSLEAVTRFDLKGVSCAGLLPRACNSERVLLWLHGGGFVMGSSVSHRGLATQVAAAARCATIIPDYRLAPEHPHPAALDDCVTAYQAILGEGVSPGAIVLAGDSAGGALAVLTAMRLREAGSPQPAGLLLLSPWTDLANTGWSHQAKAGRDPFLTASALAVRAQQYLGAATPSEAGVDILSADLRGLAPAYIQVGEAEVLLSDSVALAERLGASGSAVTLEIWPDMFHVFQARYSILSHARQAIERLGAWAQAHFEPPKAA